MDTHLVVLSEGLSCSLSLEKGFDVLVESDINY